VRAPRAMHERISVSGTAAQMQTYTGTPSLRQGKAMLAVLPIGRKPLI
jgi:hypothetical protein